ncbi:sodium:proton antiporter [Alteromonas sp. D210916BOD_24]|uniref:cation:proton antiporter n=1 Tax=Alteromonas sp. D210916BOD_24 TaxID=3157618 RepID=UPI00399D21C2
MLSLDPILILVLIGFFSIISQLIAHRLRLPAILFLLMSGVMMGPVTGLLEPDRVFGDLLFPIVSLSVAIILFEGALTLNVQELGEHKRTVTHLCSTGAIVTWIVVTPAAHYFMDISWELAFLFSAIVTVTGPTVVMPMIRAIRPSKNVAQILKWEGIVIDPIGAILAVLVFEYIVASQNAVSHTLVVFFKTILIGALVGVAAGYCLAKAIKKGVLPEYLVNTTVLISVLISFELSNLIAHESGLLAVTVMGMYLANKRDIKVDDIVEFKETLSVLLISGLFVILAARIKLEELNAIVIPASMLMLVLIFVARPLNVYLSTRKSSLKWQEKCLISWMAPRGIVAAAVSALFALKLDMIGYHNADILVTLVFFVIVFTVTLQSLTTAPLAKLLGQREEVARGFLIFGGGSFARMIAKELMALGYTVKIADTNWETIRAARMEGIPTYFGNPSSAHASRTMDLTGIGNVLVMSSYKQLNPIVTQHFQYLFGEEHVMGVSLKEQKGFEGHLPSEQYLESLGLFGDVTYSKLASQTAKGATIKRTALTSCFTFEDYKTKYLDQFTALFFIDAKGRLTPFHKKGKVELTEGYQIISLIQQAA